MFKKTLAALAIGLIAWPLLMVVLVWVGLYVLVGQWLKERTLLQTRDVNTEQATKLALLTDTLSSLDTLRTSHAGSQMQRRFELSSIELSRSSRRLRLSVVLQSHWQMAVSLLSYVSLLVLGARAVLAAAKNKSDPISRWANALAQRRGYWKAVVAIAAKNARMCWAVLSRGEDFRLPA